MREMDGGAAMSGKGEPHPLRCETCDHWKGHYDVPFCKFWDDKIPITKYGVDLISHIGCASHSSATSEQRIADVIAQVERGMITCREAISLLKGDGK